MTTLALSSLTELNKRDNSRTSGAFFHVLVRRCDINEVTLTTIWAN